ncbi:MAG: translation initiation factor IF-2, partial [Clostridiales bacterium]|nr:translation initiation factor IF-2 [Clostridiales bacterium]
AKVTDVVVLVVAADDGVMPQTVEAINHAEAAGVPIVVAINKIDKTGATPDRARQELSEHGIVPEEWGGQNMFVEVSAKKRIGIDELLEAIILQADVLELKANPSSLASGIVIEAKLDKGRGPVATVLVQRGTLHVGDTIVMGTSYGRVRALINPHGENTTEAKPSDPVEILGLNSIPDAGDDFRVFADEHEARNLVKDRSLRKRVAEHQSKQAVTLENIFSRIEQEELSELNLIVKADVQGSIEALKDALAKMDQSEVHINIIHSAVGGVTETDVTLAAASNAIIIGFNVRPMPAALKAAEHEQVDIRLYRVIYDAIEDIKKAMSGLLSPEFKEQVIGHVEVRALFKVPKAGMVAGCYVQDGKMARNARVRVVRDSVVVAEDKIDSLRRFKDDAKEVLSGFECGIGLENFNDIKEGDIIEAFVMEEIQREL